MIALKQCAELIGIAPNELDICAAPSARHRSLLESYLFNLKRGEKAVCSMIIGDFWRLRELGAPERAADALLVLRLFLSEHPQRPICWLIRKTVVQARPSKARGKWFSYSGRGYRKVNNHDTRSYRPQQESGLGDADEYSGI
jgi:hypothetical protein